MTAPTCPYRPADLARLVAGEPELVRCPYPLYEVLRSEEPVAYAERIGAYAVTRYADAIEVLRDHETYSSTMASGPSSVTGLAQRLVDDPATPETLRAQAARRLRMAQTPVLLLTDPPQHKRQRQLVSAAFSPKRINALEPEVRRLATELIDGFAARGSVELVSEFALPLPMTVIATLLGVPPQDMADFKRWADAFTAGVGADRTAEEIAQMFADIDAFYDYFTAAIESRRAHPQDDLITDLLSARMDGEEPLSVDEILLMMSQFIVGGHETTTLMITSAAYRFATDPALADRVRKEPALIPGLMEEMLRLDAPVQGMFRVTTRPTRLGEVDLPEGALLWVVFGSANRDPEAFPHPDELPPPDASSKSQPHLTFGRFEHFCLGSAVARLELRLATELLLTRLPDLALGCDPADLRRHGSFVLHGYPELPLRFTPKEA
ncbi:cytochrome P450 [Sporichthya polymorpha]|uniref:cytochrome P450 n=1 Tax=Sporichthya polymorpha TaxID=35751 RepID=UPI0003661559|nr:cytochrome P450 [Sporichthya polymorpha]